MSNTTATAIVLEAVRQIWQDSLCCDANDRDTLVGLGGTSIQGLQIVSQVCDRFGVRVPVLSIFRCDLAEFSAVVADAQPIEALADDGVPARVAPAPVSFAQQRLWLAHQRLPEQPDQNLAYAFCIHGALDENALSQAVSELLRRHAALRVVLVPGREGPVQRVRAAEPIQLITEPVAVRDFQTHARAEARQSFDLAQGPLIRFRLIGSAQCRVLLITIHHAVTDRHSTMILLRELGEFYDAYHQRRQPASPAVPDYAVLDFARDQRKRYAAGISADEREFWREFLPNGMCPFVSPTDSGQSGETSWARVEVPAALRESLSALGRRQDATLFMTLLALWQLALVQLSGHTEGTVTIPVSGRHLLAADARDAVGYFANHLLVPVSVAPEVTVDELIAQVRATALQAYAHQDTPAELLLDQLEPDAEPNRGSLWANRFGVEEGSFDTALALPGLQVEAVSVPHGIGRFDLEMQVETITTGLRVTLLWRESRYTEDQAHTLLKTYLEGLYAAVDGSDAGNGN